MTNNNLTFYSSPLQSLTTICLGLVLTEVSTSSEISTECPRRYLQEPNHSMIIVQSNERIQFIIFIYSQSIVEGGMHPMDIPWIHQWNIVLESFQIHYSGGR